MADEDNFARELVKQLPIKEAYSDLARPGAKQAGQLVEDLVKLVQLATFPVQYVAALQDRYRKFLDRSVRRVPPENRVSPAPQLVGPILESIRYEPEGTTIEEMFSQLMSRACDTKRLDDAHPAYPLIIKQLSPDEAKMLIQLEHRVPVELRQHFDASKNYFSAPELVAHKFEGLAFPQNVLMYLVHLKQLGLMTEEVMRRDVVPVGRTGDYGIWCDETLSELGKHFVRAVGGA